MSVFSCGFVARFLFYVWLCVFRFTLFYFKSASLPKPVNRSSPSAPSGTSMSAPGCAAPGGSARTLTLSVPKTLPFSMPIDMVRATPE